VLALPGGAGEWGGSGRESVRARFASVAAREPAAGTPLNRYVGAVTLLIMRRRLLVLAYAPVAFVVLTTLVAVIMSSSGVDGSTLHETSWAMMLLGSPAIVVPIAVYIRLVVRRRSMSPWERGGWVLSFILLPFVMLLRYHRQYVRGVEHG